MPCRIIKPNLELSHAPIATNKINDNNSHTRHPQCAITSEGGHAYNTPPITSKGAHSLLETLSPQLVPRRLLRYGHIPHGHRPRRQPLVSAASSKRRHPPRHRKRNGILGTHEVSSSTTTLDARIWQRMRKPLPGNSRHSRNRYMFLHQTDKHPERQKDHLRQNSLRLKTSQKRKGTCPANRRRRQTRLLRRRRHFHSRYHNFQSTNQQHPLHRGRHHDDDGH
jgi:hypothetical protein